MLTEHEHSQVIDNIQVLEDIQELPEIQGYLAVLRKLYQPKALTWRERFFALWYGYLPKRKD
jgi:hypothetical protein